MIRHDQFFCFLVPNLFDTNHDRLDPVRPNSHLRLRADPCPLRVRATTICLLDGCGPVVWPPRGLLHACIARSGAFNAGGMEMEWKPAPTVPWAPPPCNVAPLLDQRISANNNGALAPSGVWRCVFPRLKIRFRDFTQRSCLSVHDKRCWLHC